ncbi:MAG: hypothetical protein AUH14_01805 [Candidatus Rokubacteria bacterium 13_2_20CM_69_15_1]|nr:MAG: hypothetical protein AUH14_01805 [Candidatus Rokubacteria bacterium 13_2_20CM_69_15_1]
MLGEYAQQILSQAFFFAIAAITVDLLWGYTGILTFGQSAFFGVGVYTVALALAYYVEGALGTAAVMLGAMVAAALIGAAVGWLSFFDRASPIYVAIVTLALPVVFTQVILSGGAYTGSSSGLPIPVPAFSIMQWYWVSGGLLLLVALVSSVLVSSDTGRLLVAIRENEERCRYLGLRTSRLKIRLMAACSAVAALAGSGYVLFGSVAAHSYGDFVFGTELVVWTALGGRGTLVGPILGTVGVNYVSAVLGGNLPFVWLLFVGFAFVLIVVYLPQGLVPAIAGALSRVSVGSARARATTLQVRPAAAGSGARRGNATPGAEQGTPVLELRKVSKRYGSLQVLDGVSLQARRGEVVGIVGPNGAGKTTLLRCIADGRERSSGDIASAGSSRRRTCSTPCPSWTASVSRARTARPPRCGGGRARSSCRSPPSTRCRSRGSCPASTSRPATCPTERSRRSSSRWCSRWSRRSCFSTSRRPGSRARSARRSAAC